MGNPTTALPKTGDQVNWKLTSKTTGEDISVTGFAGVKKSGAIDPPGVPQEFFVTWVGNNIVIERMSQEGIRWPREIG